MALCVKLAYALKGLGLVFLLLVYELFCFVGFLSLAIGISTAIAKGYEYFFNPSTFPPTIHAFAGIYFLATFSEIHIFCHRQCIRPTVAYYDTIYHSSISSTAKVLYVFLFMFAYIQLYVLFQEVHMSPYNPNYPYPYPRPVTLEPTGTSSADPYHTACFLLALAYIVYCTAKLTHYDLIKQLRQLENPASCVHCVVTFGFLIVHFLIDILYSVPLLMVSFSVRTYNYSGLSCYLHLTLTAFVSGFVFAVLETRRPFPTKRFLRPFYFHENNNRAKASLAQLLFVLILMAFYNTHSDGKIPANKFTAENNHVILFCLAVAFVVLHMTKTLVYIVIDTNMRPHELQAQLRIDEEQGPENDRPPAGNGLPLEIANFIDGHVQVERAGAPDNQGLVSIQVIPHAALHNKELDVSKAEEAKQKNKNNLSDPMGMLAMRAMTDFESDTDDDNNCDPGIIVIAEELVANDKDFVIKDLTEKKSLQCIPDPQPETPKIVEKETNAQEINEASEILNNINNNDENQNTEGESKDIPSKNVEDSSTPVIPIKNEPQVILPCENEMESSPTAEVVKSQTASP